MCHNHGDMIWGGYTPTMSTVELKQWPTKKLEGGKAQTELSGWALLRVYKPLVTLKKGEQREVGGGGNEGKRSLKVILFKREKWAEEMAEWLRACTVLMEELSSVPLTRPVAHDQPYLQFRASMGTRAHLHTLAYIFSHICTLTYIVSHAYPLLAYSHTHLHTLLNSHTLTHILSHLHIHNLK